MSSENPKRAQSPEQKRIIIERLYEAWLRAPELRLGQLIYNALPSRSHPKWDDVRAMDEGTLYLEMYAPSLAAHSVASVEDVSLVERVEAFCDGAK